MSEKFTIEVETFTIEAKDSDAAVYEFKKRLLLGDLSLTVTKISEPAVVHECLKESDERRCRYALPEHGCSAPHTVRCSRCLTF